MVPVTVLWMSILPAALQAKDEPPGGLLFLGQTADGSRSVWLSATGSGSFVLEATGKQVVDQWDRSRRGLHVSLSPDVSNGNGQPHTLYAIVDGKLNEIDKQNQKGGIIFPPVLQRPPGLPPFLRPPTGVTPSLPMGVRPPIGTLPPGGVSPPTGITPGVPGAVTPPIATLPPGGPPTGVTPTLPGAVTPPIATLPPTGVMPGVPGAVTPPIATLPPGGPPTGVTPTLPGAVTPPIATLPPTGVMPAVPGGAGAAARIPDSVPITPGREFAGVDGWNLWADGRYTDIEDSRNGLDLDGHTNTLTLGVDHSLNARLVIGGMATMEHSPASSFGGVWKTEADGLTVGPYVGYLLSDSWALDGSLGVGRFSNDNYVDVLRGHYRSDRLSAALTATGQYGQNEWRLRPKVSAAYTWFQDDAHDMSAWIDGLWISLPVADASFGFGVTEATVELSRAFLVARGSVLVPYIEIGARYEFDRPNDGRILTSSLTLVSSSPWSGSARLRCPGTGVEQYIH